MFGSNEQVAGRQKCKQWLGVSVGGFLCIEALPAAAAATEASQPPATHLLLPPASRKDPSAEKAREVKQRPLLVLSALRRSERRRPPAMSRRPEMVPCEKKEVQCAGGQLLVMPSLGGRAYSRPGVPRIHMHMPAGMRMAAGPAAVQAAVHSSTGSSAHLQGGLMRVPEVDLPIQGGGGQHLAIGAPRQRQHIMLQGGEGGQQRVDGVHSIAIRHLGLQNISTGTTKQSSSRFGRCSPAGRASSRVPAGGAGAGAGSCLPGAAAPPWLPCRSSSSSSSEEQQPAETAECGFATGDMLSGGLREKQHSARLLYIHLNAYTQ